MHTLTFIDLEARVLDKPEREKAVKILEIELNKRFEQMRSLVFPTPQGKIDGVKLFVIAQEIDDQIDPYQSHPLVFESTLGYAHLIDQLAQLDPTFYEYPFVNGKNILTALEIKEIEVINNRENLTSDNNLMTLKKRIFGFYEKIENYLKKASELFDKFTDSLNNNEDKELMKMYRGKIKSRLAQMYRRKAFFILRSTPTSEEATQLENLVTILKLTRMSVNLHRELFQNEIFLDDYEAAATLANLANALKIFGAQEGMKGLKYYEEARNICGPHPLIEEGISVYRILASDYDGIKDHSYFTLLH